MKNLSFCDALLIALLMNLCLISCSGDDNDIVNGEYISGTDGVVSTGVPLGIGPFSATVTCTADSILLGNSYVKKFGVSYGKDPAADESLCTASTIKGSTYSITLTNLKPETSYFYKAYIVISSGTTAYGSTRKLTTTSLKITSGETVDLGLPSGTKWASHNVGASNPEDYGSYFAWGETSPKSEYDYGSSVTQSVEYFVLRRRGVIDSNGNLTAAYDAATVNWGSEWRMPTSAEMNELLTCCMWTWTPYKGVNGCVVTGRNGNSIFLPAAGSCQGLNINNAGSYGEYWSSTVYSNDYYPFHFAEDLIFYSGRYITDTYFRYSGFSIRPVQ